VDEVPGVWRWLDGWPPSGLEERRLYPAPDGSLGPVPAAAEATHRTTTPPATGIEAGFWWGELVPDQRPIDDRSLRYDTSPLESDVVIVGMPRAVLRAAAGAPLAHWFVRLCDVAPDGTSVLVSGAGLNGAHRRSAMRPEQLEPGREERLEVELHATSWTFPAGHRIRLAVTNAMWPMIWPSPFLAETSLRVGGDDGTCVVLPVLPDADALPSPSWDPPAPKVAAPSIRSGGDQFPAPWTVSRNEHRETTTVSWAGRQRLELGWCGQTYSEAMTYEVVDDDPAGASVTGEAESTVALPGRTLVWRGELEIRSDAEAFHYRFRRTLSQDGLVIRERRWDERVQRDFQ
jgi:predicted acyl esterase